MHARALLVIVVLLVWPLPAQAQHEHHAAPPVEGWGWRLDAQAFLNFNIQERRFRDFHVVESQNWFMTGGTRRVGRGRLDLNGMLSFEPWTVRDLGSPQVFQTGETFRGAALVDYQHPHDFVMQATARFEWPFASRWQFPLEGGPVGAPAIGPTGLHASRVGRGQSDRAARPSQFRFHARDARSGHRRRDARAALRLRRRRSMAGSQTKIGSSIEFGPIDSYAGRVWFRRGGWEAQISAAHLNQPDRTEFSDHNLFTASVSYSGSLAGRPLAVTAAFGFTDEPGTGRRTPAGLLEGIWRPSPHHAIYTRGELLVKDVLTRGGFHPPGFTHPHHPLDDRRVDAWLRAPSCGDRVGQFGVGADITGYYRDVNLFDGYGDPFSAHIFLRYRFDTR